MSRNGETVAAAVGASDKFVTSTAWGTTLRWNRWGLLVRGVCLGTLIAVVASSAQPLRALLLVPSLAGLVLAVGEAYDDLLTRIPEHGILGNVRERLTSKRENHIAGPSISGVMEWLGMLFSAFAIAGPYPLTVDGIAKASGVVALLVLTWSGLSQTVLDVSWYNRNVPPRWWMSAFRWLSPLIAAACTYVLLAWPSVLALPDSTQALPSSSALILSVGFLLVWPFIALLTTALDAGAQQYNELLVALPAERAEAARDVAHRLKGGLKDRLAVLDDDDDAQLVERRVTESLFTEVAVEWKWFTEPEEGLTATGIWEACCQVRRIGAGQADGLITFSDSGMGARRFGSYPDADVLRTVLVDLVSNSLTARASKIVVTVSQEPYSDELARVVLVVQDNGPGYTANHYDRATSLGGLQWMLQTRLEGGLSHQAINGTGTRTTATFLAQLTPDEDATTTTTPGSAQT